MWNEADLPGILRSRIRPCLPNGAFLRRDRGDALFISNAPVLGSCPETIPGFILETRGNMLCLLPDESWSLTLERSRPEPPDALSQSLVRFRGEMMDRSALHFFARGLKLLDAMPTPPEKEILAFDRLLRQRAALALRGAASGGGLYAAALLRAALTPPNHK